MSELKQSIAQLLIDNFKGATSKKASDMAIAIMAFVNADREREIESAFCGTPGTGECSCRKFADNPLKCDNRHTQPEATKPAQPLYASNAASTACEGTGPKLHVRHAAPAQDLSAAILALPLPKPFDSGDGNHEDKFTESQFREFRAVAAALASPADALVAGDRVDAERWRFRQKFLMDGGAVLWSQRGCQYRNAQGAIICQGGTEEEAINAAIQAQKDGHG